jgi:hypothetical protein
MKRHIERTNICKMEPNMYFQNTTDQNIILSLLPDDDKLKDLIIKVKSKDYQNLYQSRRRLLMKKLSGSEDCKKCCSYCNTKFNKIQELREHVLIDCFLEEILEKNDNTTTDNKSSIINNDNSHTINNITNNIDNSQKITNNINNIDNSIKNIDNSTTNIIINVPISFDKSWDISNIDTVYKKLEILCSDVLYSKLLEKLLENKKNRNVLFDKKNNIGFVYKNEDEKYISMNMKDIASKSMEKLHENLLEINNDVKKHTNNKNHQEYAKDCIEKEKKINNKYTGYKDDYGTRNYANESILNIYDDKKDESLEIFENINGSDKIEE